MNIPLQISYMSFSDLRSAREARKAKSFVKDSSESKNGQSDVSMLTQSEPGITDIDGAAQDEDAPSVSHDMFMDSELVDDIHVRELPDTLEIRKNAVTGRGIYAADDISMGTLFWFPLRSLETDFVPLRKRVDIPTATRGGSVNRLLRVILLLVHEAR